MTEIKILEEGALNDYVNHFHRIISYLKRGRKLSNINLKMPLQYLQKRYPKVYNENFTYPENFSFRRLSVAIECFNKLKKKTVERILQILRIIGGIFYNDSGVLVNKVKFALN
jgi:hypothetical protein